MTTLRDLLTPTPTPPAPPLRDRLLHALGIHNDRLVLDAHLRGCSLCTQTRFVR